MRLQSMVLAALGLILLLSSVAQASPREPVPVVVVEAIFSNWEEREAATKAALDKGIELSSKVPCIQELSEKGEKIELEWSRDFAPTADGKFKVHVEIYHKSCQ